MNIKTKLLISLLMTLTQLTVINSSVKAEYVPPAEQERASDYSKSTGVRTGFQTEKEMLPLTILAPVSYVGHTASTTPTFVWAYGNSDNNYEMDFRLFEFDQQDNVQQRGKATIINSKGGIIALPFPSEMSPLEQGKKYLWQISIRNSQQESIWQRAEFRVVEMSANLASSIKNRQELEKAELYAEHGLWYDALTNSLPPSSTNKLEDSAQDLVCALAESEIVYLSDTIPLAEKNVIAQRVVNLNILCLPKQ